jgi:hypothetical protein
VGRWKEATATSAMLHASSGSVLTIALPQCDSGEDSYQDPEEESQGHLENTKDFP